MKKSIILGVFFCFSSIFLVSQSAERMTMMLDKQTVTAEELSYFVVHALNSVNDEISDSEAFDFLTKQVALPKIKDKSVPLTYATFSYFCTTAWNIKGGIMLSILKNPRYALREFKSLGLIEVNKNPYATISGQDALVLLAKCDELFGAKNHINGAKNEN